MGKNPPVGVPSQTLEALPREAGEKILASGHADSGEDVIATSHALCIVHDGSLLRKDWTDVESIALSKERVLTVVWATGEPTSTLSLSGADRRLASVLGERLTRSVVASDLIKLPGGSVKIAIRRAADESLFSQVLVHGPLDIDDPAIARLVSRTEDALRNSVGLES